MGDPGAISSLDARVATDLARDSDARADRPAGALTEAQPRPTLTLTSASRARLLRRGDTYRLVLEGVDLNGAPACLLLYESPRAWHGSDAVDYMLSVFALIEQAHLCALDPALDQPVLDPMLRTNTRILESNLVIAFPWLKQ